MNTNGGIKIRVRRSHDCSGSPAGRQAGDINSALFNRKVAHDRAGYSGDQRGFAAITKLVACAEPIPTSRRVG
jgi:hypothetical protein